MKNYLLLFAGLLLQQLLFAQYPALNLELADTSTKVLDSIVEVNNGASPNYISNRIQYAYDSEGREIRSTDLGYSPIAPHPLSSGQRVITDFLSNREVQSTQTWNDIDWENSSRQTDQLDTDGRIVERIRESWLLGLSVWEKEQRLTYTYDGTTDRPSIILIDDWLDENWELDRRLRYTYDADGLLRKLEVQIWNFSTQDWELDRETDYTYDELEQLTARLTYDLVDNTTDLFLSIEERFFYNGDTQLDSAFTLRNGPDGILSGTRNQYFYENSTVSYDTFFVWQAANQDWARFGYLRLERDADADLQTVAQFLIDRNTGLPIPARTQTYYYSQLNVGTTAPAPQAQLNCLVANPHPGPQTVTCSTASEPVRDIVARVYDLQGRLHWSRPLQAQGRDWSVELDPDLPRGLYLLVWESAEGILGQQKLLVP